MSKQMKDINDKRSCTSSNCHYIDIPLKSNNTTTTNNDGIIVLATGKDIEVAETFQKEYNTTSLKKASKSYCFGFVILVVVALLFFAPPCDHHKHHHHSHHHHHPYNVDLVQDVSPSQPEDFHHHHAFMPGDDVHYNHVHEQHHHEGIVVPSPKFQLLEDGKPLPPIATNRMGGWNMNESDHHGPMMMQAQGDHPAMMSKMQLHMTNHRPIIDENSIDKEEMYHLRGHAESAVAKTVLRLPESTQEESETKGWWITGITTNSWTSPSSDDTESNDLHPSDSMDVASSSDSSSSDSPDDDDEEEEDSFDSWGKTWHKIVHYEGSLDSSSKDSDSSSSDSKDNRDDDNDQGEDSDSGSFDWSRLAGNKKQFHTNPEPREGVADSSDDKEDNKESLEWGEAWKNMMMIGQSSNLEEERATSKMMVSPQDPIRNYFHYDEASDSHKGSEMLLDSSYTYNKNTKHQDVDSVSISVSVPIALVKTEVWNVDDLFSDELVQVQDDDTMYESETVPDMDEGKDTQEIDAIYSISNSVFESLEGIGESVEREEEEEPIAAMEFGSEQP